MSIERRWNRNYYYYYYYYWTSHRSARRCRWCRSHGVPPSHRWRTGAESSCCWGRSGSADSNHTAWRASRYCQRRGRPAQACHCYSRTIRPDWEQIICTSLFTVDVDARRRLRSSSTSALVGPRTLRATIGDRAFPAAAASVWNSLPESVRASSSLPVFRGRLKTELFSRSYSCPD